MMDSQLTLNLGDGVKPKKPGKVIKLTPHMRRIADTAVEIIDNPVERIAYQHTVLCQTVMPYKNQGLKVRRWQRKNGRAHLLIEAGSALHPEKKTFVELPLPFGPKPRVILAYLNAEALRSGSPVIEVEDTLTAFVKKVLGRDPNGREIRVYKAQLSALSAAVVRMGVVEGPRAFQVNTHVVAALDLWFPKDEKQRVLWPATVRLGQEYFESLCEHAVPLDVRAIAALSNSAMGLDVYAWLAQRLHRIPKNKPQFVAWQALKEQFGQDYARIVDFRRFFLRNLHTVNSVYSAANIENNAQGLTLHHSVPPVPPRTFSLISSSDS